MSETDLAQALRSGQRPSDPASAKGGSRDDLLAAVKRDVAAHAPAGVAAADGAITRIATGIIDGRRPEGAGGTHHRHDHDGAAAPQRLAEGFEQVAQGPRHGRRGPG